MRLTSKSMTRYTIFAKSGPSIESHPAFASDSASTSSSNQEVKVPLADFSTHSGQTARLKPPPIGDGFSSRLEGLKQYKIWGERIKHGADDVTSHSDGAEIKRIINHTAVERIELSKSPRVHTRPLRSRADSIDTRLDAAPTPFPTPQFKPANVSATEPLQLQPVYSASPPTLDLKSSPSRGRGECRAADSVRHRSLSRTIVIASTPIDDLVQRSRSYSQSSQISKSRSSNGRYPPTSFPNAKSDEHELNTRLTTPSISPMTKPKSDQDIEREVHGTPHDKRGRPLFYSTIRYFTECPHASPPANQPLDPEGQPRLDVNFFPNNPKVTRSIIPGMCFNCDTFHRREQENMVLADCYQAVLVLKDRLAHELNLFEEVDVESSDDEEEAYDMLRAPRTLHHQASEISLPPVTDEPVMSVKSARRLTPDEKTYQARLVFNIRKIEGKIDEIRDCQDEKIKNVWRGYTRRWGPAAVGVQRGDWSKNLSKYETADDHDALLEYQRRSIEERLSLPDEIDQLRLDDEGEEQIISVSLSEGKSTKDGMGKELRREKRDVSSSRAPSAPR